jgi:hypothetical protein
MIAIALLPLTGYGLSGNSGRRAESFILAPPPIQGR